MDPRYQVWSRALTSDPDSHHEKDVARRILEPRPIEIMHQPKFPLSRNDSVYAIGSCFARNIEGALSKDGFDVLSCKLELPANCFLGGKNPSTVLTKFNTYSMVSEIEEAFGERSLQDDGLIEIPEKGYINPQLHRVETVDRDTALFVKKVVHDNVRLIAEANVVFVTLGLTEYWFDKQLGIPLNDVPPWRLAKKNDRFEFRNSNYLESRAEVEKLCKNIFEKSKTDVKIVLTVSPVPLFRTFSNQDIIVANSYSKSTLRAVAQDVANGSDRIDYFPSYEMVMNSPRDITWDHDQRHVRWPVIKNIIEYFSQVYFASAE